MNRSEQLNELAAALVKAQTDMKNPPLDSENPFFKNQYASLAAVRDTVTPFLTKAGLVVTQLIGHQEDGITVETVLLHSSGQWLSSTFYMPATKKDAQGYGSAITYGRRYALMAICNVVGDVEDDANTATAKPTKEPVTPTAGAWEKITPEQQSRLTDLANVVKEYLADKDVAQAVKVIEDFGLDADTKVALWTKFDSKERSALKREKQEAALREGGQI